MSDSHSPSKSSSILNLVEASYILESHLKMLLEINNKSHFIAMSAAIEGARMKNKMDTFSIVAGQIASQTTKYLLLSDKIESIIKKIQKESLFAVGVRNYELSCDLIDKLDRNLFERNCDVQSWAGFDGIKKVLTDRTPDNVLESNHILKNLVKTYVVYLDSILIDLKGEVVSVANCLEFMGKNFSQETWFLEVMKNQVYVTDLEYIPLLDKNSVSYCAPVLNEEGKVIGLLKNFFNWDYALEMIQSGDYSENQEVSLINSKGMIIGSKNQNLILSDHLNWLDAGVKATEKLHGFSIEKSRNGHSIASGFAYTNGYNSYKGKGWSAVILEKMFNNYHKNEISVISKTDKIESEIVSTRLLSTMKEIDQLVLELNSNNREVKLLAINASIQSGIAGNDGEGFSVIANEVSELAKKSLTFVESVNLTTKELRHAVLNSSNIRLVDAAKDAMSKVDRNIFERFCDVQAFSTFPIFRSICHENNIGDEDIQRETNSLLEKLHKIYEVYHDIYVLDLNGEIIGAAINKSNINKNLKDNEFFTEAISGKTFVSDIYNSSMVGATVMSFSSPIFSDSVSIIGVIATKFNCNFLNDILKVTIIDSESMPYLLNSEMQVIASKFDADVFSMNFSNIKFTNEDEKSSSGYLEVEDINIGFAMSAGYNTYKAQEWTLIIKRKNNKKNQKQDNVTPEERFLMLLNNKIVEESA